MGVLLYLPALLMNLNFHFGIIKTLASVAFLGVMQVVIGLEFILFDYKKYFGHAFELTRVFLFKWSVNWQFLGEEVATSKQWALILLVLQLSLLLIFLLFKWTFIRAGLSKWFQQIRLNELFASAKQLDPYYVALSMFTCNFIGIVCARSLHF
jgi:alpha-1,3-mannosyltransferase